MANTVSCLFLLPAFLTSPRRRLRLCVVVAERRLMVQRIVVADQLPADLVVIARVHRARKKPDDGMRADRIEERRLLDGGERFDLLLGSKRREFLGARIKLLHFGLKIAQALNVGGLAGLKESRER